jgi:hypothetical protein
MKILSRYKIRTRTGIRFFTNKAEAIRSAKLQQRYGCPSWVRDERNSQLVWK